MAIQNKASVFVLSAGQNNTIILFTNAETWGKENTMHYSGLCLRACVMHPENTRVRGDLKQATWVEWV